MVKIFYNPISNFNHYLCNEVLQFGQLLNNRYVRLSQPHRVVNTLHKISQSFCNLTSLEWLFFYNFIVINHNSGYNNLEISMWDVTLSILILSQAMVMSASIYVLKLNSFVRHV